MQLDPRTNVRNSLLKSSTPVFPVTGDFFERVNQATEVGVAVNRMLCSFMLPRDGQTTHPMRINRAEPCFMYRRFVLPSGGTEFGRQALHHGRGCGFRRITASASGGRLSRSSARFASRPRHAEVSHARSFATDRSRRRDFGLPPRGRNLRHALYQRPELPIRPISRAAKRARPPWSGS
jgi:hypothetical protein